MGPEAQARKVGVRGGVAMGFDRERYCEPCDRPMTREEAPLDWQMLASSHLNLPAGLVSPSDGSSGATFKFSAALFRCPQCGRWFLKQWIPPALRQSEERSNLARQLTGLPRAWEHHVERRRDTLGGNTTFGSLWRARGLRRMPMSLPAANSCLQARLRKHTLELGWEGPPQPHSDPPS